MGCIAGNESLTEEKTNQLDVLAKNKLSGHAHNFNKKTEAAAFGSFLVEIKAHY